ncbi:MAG: 50S ribosomal protein L3 N(5)-glutamine methyltransferase [Thiotrichaceae bacterium]|nr:50S ribosomal protein L3 N(5)-glutamine methyltransferase [Thiotrichaceae bacterium]
MTDKTSNHKLVELYTIKDYIRWAASEFARSHLAFEHGMDNALDEAVYIVLRCLHLPIDTAAIYWDGRLLLSERQEVQEIIQQRISTRKPAAYLLNEGWFAGLPFYINDNVLVPRSPIAELIAQRFEPWLDPEETHHILDLCTGSGCIGIACAYAFAGSKVDISDLSPLALEVAEKNIQRHHLADYVTTIESDLFTHIPAKQYDLIVSNPPYVDAEDMSALSQEGQCEPVMGLAAGNDGLSIVHTMLAQAVNYLSEQGVLVVEVGNSQYALQQYYPDVPFEWQSFEQGGDGVFLLTKHQLEIFFTKSLDD